METMDRTLFTGQKTGELIHISTPQGPDWAFTPNPLPPANWKMPSELLDLLIEAWDNVGALNGIGRTLPNPELLLRPLQEREAIQSSMLEGTYTTPEEVLLFAKNPSDPKSESDPANGWREVHNYKTSLHAGYVHLQDRPFTLNLIRDLHRDLMTGVRGREKTPGEFRRQQVGIGSDYRFIPPPPQDVARQLDRLEKYLNVEVPKQDRLTQAFFAHYQFETIHPFMDGNGRVGRLLLALMLYKLCDHQMPWLYLSPYFEKYKDEYVNKLFRISANGEWGEWLAFCLRGTIRSAKDGIKRCEMLKRLKGEYTQRVTGQTTARTHQLLEGLFQDPLVRIVDVKNHCGVSYKTAKGDIDVLRRTGILRQLKGHYPACFFAWEIFRIAYRDEPEFAEEHEIQAAIASASLPTEPQPPS
jgi:Fic family protein